MSPDVPLRCSIITIVREPGYHITQLNPPGRGTWGQIPLLGETKWGVRRRSPQLRTQHVGEVTGHLSAREEPKAGQWTMNPPSYHKPPTPGPKWSSLALLPQSPKPPTKGPRGICNEAKWDGEGSRVPTIVPVSWLAQTPTHQLHPLQKARNQWLRDGHCPHPRVQAEAPGQRNTVGPSPNYPSKLFQHSEATHWSDNRLPVTWDPHLEINGLQNVSLLLGHHWKVLFLSTTSRQA